MPAHDAHHARREGGPDVGAEAFHTRPPRGVEQGAQGQEKHQGIK